MWNPAPPSYRWVSQTRRMQSLSRQARVDNELSSLVAVFMATRSRAMPVEGRRPNCDCVCKRASPGHRARIEMITQGKCRTRHKLLRDSHRGQPDALTAHVRFWVGATLNQSSRSFMLNFYERARSTHPKSSRKPVFTSLISRSDCGDAQSLSDLLTRI